MRMLTRVFVLFAVWLPVVLPVAMTTAAEATATATMTETAVNGGKTDDVKDQPHPLVQTDEVVEVAVNDGIDFDETDYSFAHPIFQRGLNLGNYLRKDILDRHKSIDTMRHQLDIGSVVVIPNAFDAEFAEAMHEELMNTNAFLNQTQRIFTSAETKQFMSDFTSLDCTGHTSAAPSYYAPGDYSNPHSDHQHQRSLSFVWHLTREDWKPEWGGALYWCSGHPNHSYLQASFNTLIIFKPTTQSQHFVTRVSHNVTGNAKRLAYNGWYHASWVPQHVDDLDPWLKNAGPDMTEMQFEGILEILNQGQLEPEQERVIGETYNKLYRQRYPRARTFVELDAKKL
ncbi:hypothetical protein MHU86_11613 [Fragilaria crotonensis]|nr:hypothetical protein MHU86_11613 [Fragilaria crotonensis]